MKEKEVWWANGAFVVFSHIIGLGALFITPTWPTMLLALFTTQFAGLGITMGYHRLWSHSSYKAHFLLKCLLAIAGTIGFQGSIKWWVLRHRLHHRYTDTEFDPYNAKRGFWYSHIGWIFSKPHYPRMKWVDASDLNEDVVVAFQHRYYVPLALFFGIVLPTLLGFLWNDALGCFLYVGYLARIVIWHSTFAINSFAHSFGDQPFDTENTSRGNWILALIAQVRVGEGHHNFHHQFENDYRNGISSSDYDPTKWLIFASSKVGLTWDLNRVADDLIIKGKMRVLNENLSSLPTPTYLTLEELSVKFMTPSEFKESIEAGKLLMIINGYVTDVTDFIDKHPGGSKLLKPLIGKDATKSFYGNLNNHTNAARELLSQLYIATYRPSSPPPLLSE